MKTLLFVTTSLILFGMSAVAYWTFYHNFVPQIGLEREVHLQFGYDYLPLVNERDDTKTMG